MFGFRGGWFSTNPNVVQICKLVHSLIIILKFQLLGIGVLNMINVKTSNKADVNA